MFYNIKNNAPACKLRANCYFNIYILLYISYLSYLINASHAWNTGSIPVGATKLKIKELQQSSSFFCVQICGFYSFFIWFFRVFLGCFGNFACKLRANFYNCVQIACKFACKKPTKKMTTITIYHDTRRMKKDGTCPIYIRINFDRKGQLVHTNMSASPEEFANGRFTRLASNSTAKNAKLAKIVSQCEEEILALERLGRLQVMTLHELTDKITAIIQGREEAKKHFTDYIDEYIGKGMRPNTAATYEQTKTKIEQFDRKATFETMTKKWLEQFDRYMELGGMKTNSRSIHMRNIRTVFNFAIDEEYTSLYPFRKFKIEKEETAKRCLTVEQLRELKDFDCEEYQKPYRDIFMLMFYLIGVNAIDLFTAKHSQVRNGRFEYRRAKTNKLYSIKIQPEAQEILNRYKGKEYLLRFMEEMEGTNYHQYLYAVNRGLRKIGYFEIKGQGGKKVRTPIAPDISTYWSRHTWATIAAELDIPKETISEALGHEIGSRVTSVYIKFNQKKVDEANRKVIDYVLGK